MPPDGQSPPRQPPFDPVEATPPRRRRAGILARLFFGVFIPALIYATMLMRLVRWWGGAPEYRGWDVVLAILGGLVALLVNSWVPFVSWKTIPNAFFAGMVAPWLALSVVCYSDHDSPKQYEGLTACAVPVLTPIVFCVYQAWRYGRRRLRSDSAVETDGL